MSEFMNRPGEPDFVAGEGEKPEPIIDWLAEPLPEIKTFRDAQAAFQAVRAVNRQLAAHVTTMTDAKAQFSLLVNSGAFGLRLQKRYPNARQAFLFHPLVGSSFQPGTYTFNVPGIIDEHGEVPPPNSEINPNRIMNFLIVDTPKDEIRRYSARVRAVLPEIKELDDLMRIVDEILPSQEGDPQLDMSWQTMQF